MKTIMKVTTTATTTAMTDARIKMTTKARTKVRVIARVSATVPAARRSLGQYVNYDVEGQSGIGKHRGSNPRQTTLPVANFC